MHITQVPPDVVHTVTSGWQTDHPPRFAAAFSTVNSADTSVHLGIFIDSSLSCVVTLEPRARGIYEVHLALKRGLTVAELLPAFFSIRQQLFGQLNVKEISGWVPLLHKGIHRVAASVGFKPSGASLLQMVGSRLTEWRQWVLKADG